MRWQKRLDKATRIVQTGAEYAAMAKTVDHGAKVLATTVGPFLF